MSLISLAKSSVPNIPISQSSAYLIYFILLPSESVDGILFLAFIKFFSSCISSGLFLTSFVSKILDSSGGLIVFRISCGYALLQELLASIRSVIYLSSSCRTMFDKIGLIIPP